MFIIFFFQLQSSFVISLLYDRLENYFIIFIIFTIIIIELDKFDFI